MISIYFLLTFAHLMGLWLAVGAATVKLVLLLKAGSDFNFVSVFIKVIRPITRIIVAGLSLLTLSGIGWILLGTYFSPLFIVKLILVLAVWVLGPLIDKTIEPNYVKLAPPAGEQASPEFIKIQKKFVLMESAATGLFYVIAVMGVLL